MRVHPRLAVAAAAGTARVDRARLRRHAERRPRGASAGGVAGGVRGAAVARQGGGDRGKHSDRWVIAADTTVLLGEELLEKPGDARRRAAHARRPSPEKRTSSTPASRCRTRARHARHARGGDGSADAARSTEATSSGTSRPASRSTKRAPTPLRASERCSSIDPWQLHERSRIATCFAVSDARRRAGIDPLRREGS